jgi:transcriptional regulator with XRE-family HTH domain
MTDEQDVQGAIARRLDHLFLTVHPPDRGPYSLREAAEGINQAAGTKLISAAYLSQLRNGERAEPSHSRLAAVAQFFGVDVRYFSDDDIARRTDAELDVLATLRDSGVYGLAVRAAGLSERSLEAVRAVIENARRLEGLPDDQPAQ